MCVGVGPHNYSIDSPKFTIYQLLERRVNLTIPLAGYKSESYSWILHRGNSKLDSRAVNALFSSGHFEVHEFNFSILVQNSSLNGIQISRKEFVNNEFSLQGKRVTINTGGKYYYTDLHFSSKYLRYVYI